MTDESLGGPDARYVIALIAGLPGDSRLMRSISDDAEWTLNSVLLARLTNIVTAAIYGMAGKKAGQPPIIGPSYMVGDANSEADKVTRNDDAQSYPINELKRKLQAPRRAEPQSPEELEELQKTLLRNSGQDVIDNASGERKNS